MTDNEQTVAEPAFETDDAAMEAVWQRHEAVEQPAEPTEAPEAPAETPEAPEGPARGPDGKFVAREPAETAEPAEEKPGEPEKAETPEAAEEQAPGSLPKAIRDAWKTLAPDVREAFKASQDKMARELGQANRERQAVRPIYDQVVKAAQEFPHLADMRPDQIAAEMFELAKISHAFASDPAGTLIGLAEKHGATEALRAKLAGGDAPQAAALEQKIARLEQQISRMSDPRSLEDTISQRLSHERIMSDVQAFAHSKADWAEVEPHMAQFVQVARQMNPEGQPGEILGAAYDMAVHAVPSLRARHEQAQQQTRDAEAARSINVRAAPTRPGPLSEDQALEQVWARHFG